MFCVEPLSELKADLELNRPKFPSIISENSAWVMEERKNSVEVTFIDGIPFIRSWVHFVIYLNTSSDVRVFVNEQSTHGGSIFFLPLLLQVVTEQVLFGRSL